MDQIGPLCACIQGQPTGRFLPNPRTDWQTDCNYYPFQLMRTSPKHATAFSDPGLDKCRISWVLHPFTTGLHPFDLPQVQVKSLPVGSPRWAPSPDKLKNTALEHPINSGRHSNLSQSKTRITWGVTPGFSYWWESNTGVILRVDALRKSKRVGGLA